MGTYKYSIPIEYTHVQEEAAASWVINYGPYVGIPAIDIAADIGGVLTKIIPNQIQQNTSSQITVTFTQPYTGKAHLVI